MFYLVSFFVCTFVRTIANICTGLKVHVKRGESNIHIAFDEISIVCLIMVTVLNVISVN